MWSPSRESNKKYLVLPRMLESLARLSNILCTTYEESRSYKDNDHSDIFFNNDVLISFNNDDNNNNINNINNNNDNNNNIKSLIVVNNVFSHHA